MVDSHRIAAQHQWRSGVRSGVIGDESGLDAGALVADLDRRARNAGPRRVGHNASNDSAIGSLCQEQTAQAENSENNPHCYDEVAFHCSTLPISFPQGVLPAPPTEA